MAINSCAGHGADVMSVDWHPRKSLLASGSKDNQQPVKLWDPKAGQSVATMLVGQLQLQCNGGFTYLSLSLSLSLSLFVLHWLAMLTRLQFSVCPGTRMGIGC